MKNIDKREVRFYVCLILAYVLLMTSLFLPPLNIITTSVLYAAIAILATGALAIGIDISGILHEIRLIKTADLELLQKEAKQDEANGDVEEN